MRDVLRIIIVLIGALILLLGVVTLYSSYSLTDEGDQLVQGTRAAALFLLALLAVGLLATEHLATIAGELTRLRKMRAWELEQIRKRQARE